MYVDDFLLASNTMATLEALKELLAKEYEMKDLGEVKTIIGWQITRDTATGTMKLDQSAFIRDLVIEEGPTDYNAKVIPVKAGLATWQSRCLTQKTMKKPISENINV